MPSPIITRHAPSWRTLSFLCALAGSANGQVDAAINEEVWKQKFGVLDAQMSEQVPYAGWLSQDADGDGEDD